MPTLLIRHQRVDLDQWLQAFHMNLQVRRAHGAIDEVILRNALAPDDVWILIEWDDLYRAQLFARSEALQDEFDQSGIVRSPDIWFLESLDLRDYVAQTMPIEGGDLPTAEVDDERLQ